MAGIAGNDQAWLEMAINGSKLLEMAEMVGNGWKWLDMAGNGWKVARMAEYCCKYLEIAVSC